jgi:hypothetical protein
MAQISVDGQVISEIELKTSAKNTPYVRFEIVEYIGKGEKQRAQYFHVCAFAEHALGIVNAGIGKGSHIQLYGKLEVETYGKRDGKGVGKRMKIMLKDWGSIPIGESKRQMSLDKAPPEMVMPDEVIEIDGDKEPMPK